MTSQADDGPIVTLIEFTIDANRLAQFEEYMDKVAPGTRAYPGNLSFESCRDPANDAHIIQRVVWSDMTSQKQYMQWRESTGVFDEIRDFIVVGPELTYWKLNQTY
ncbi:putative quinol monooxygenase [Aquisediminimonas profunda]|uniref:putative quinol monooxygenase n=1 Tax=Aquisediminimonas profunda TaxID=1550733 RepID=UPI001C62AA5B|nr:antibiotic biosynthesis monooxygenase [Aquisediminimonas profunda]